MHQGVHGPVHGLADVEKGARGKRTDHRDAECTHNGIPPWVPARSWLWRPGLRRALPSIKSHGSWVREVRLCI